MIRKFVAAFAVAVIAFGSIFAEEIKGTFVSFDKDKGVTISVTGKDDKKEDKTFKVPADLKMKMKNFKDGTESEVSVVESLTKMEERKAKSKGGKGGFAPTVVVEVDEKEKDTVKSLKYEFNFKKKDTKKDN